MKQRFEHGGAKKKLIPILRIDDDISRAFAAELYKRGIKCAKVRILLLFASTALTQYHLCAHSLSITSE